MSDDRQPPPLTFRETVECLAWLGVLTCMLWLNLHILNAGLKEMSRSPALQEMIKIEELLRDCKR